MKKLRTPFMDKFTAAFIGDPKKIKEPAPPPHEDPWPDPNRLWPTPGQTLTSVVADFEMIGSVLLTVAYAGGAPPSFPNGSLGDRIVKFLAANHWPSGDGVPPEYQDELPTVYLVEVAVIKEHLLQAMNSFNPSGGTGGGGSNWPPH